MTGVITVVVTPKNKTKSTPLANHKVRSITKSAVSFQSFPVSLRGFISESGRLTTDVLEITNALDIEGLSTTVDIEKAFDSIKKSYQH